MNNDRLIKFALDAGLLNYVDNETPRHYFLRGHADLPEIEEFAKLIIRECAYIASVNQYLTTDVEPYVLKHFGVKE